MIRTDRLFHYFPHNPGDLAGLFARGLQPLNARSTALAEDDRAFYSGLSEVFAAPVPGP